MPTLDDIFTGQRPIHVLRTGPFKDVIDDFLSHVVQLGYTEQYLWNNLRLVVHFSRWVEKKGLSLKDLDFKIVDQFQTEFASKQPFYYGGSYRKFLAHFCDFLSNTGVSPIILKKEPPPTPVERCLIDYKNYITEMRGLNLERTTGYCFHIRQFLVYRFGLKGTLKLDHINARDIQEFVLHRSTEQSSKTSKLMMSALRSFLKFVTCTGKSSRNLAGSVPVVRHFSGQAMPPSLSRREVQRLLQSCDRKTAMGKRDYAVLLLLARYGLRSAELMRLTLDDIDWKNSELTIVAKGKKEARLPMPSDVGQALADYIRNGRPNAICESRRVFIRSLAPYRPLTAGVGDIVRHSLKRAGIKSSHSGAHLLRYTVASEVMNRGGSLEDAGELLRHSHVDTTSIYIKLDTNRLRNLARPWPAPAHLMRSLSQDVLLRFEQRSSSRGAK